MQTRVHEPGSTNSGARSRAGRRRAKGYPVALPKSKQAASREVLSGQLLCNTAGMANSVYLTRQLSYLGEVSWGSVLSAGTGPADPEQGDFLGAKIKEEVMR